MDLIIDGYNLLHVTGIFADTVGPSALNSLHARFVAFLASSLPPDQSARTTVVFDAKGRRATARREIRQQGIKIVYAARDEEADSVIRELVQKHFSPRNLTVVSSDHQVQRAARRRRATAVDSDCFFREVLRSQREREAPARHEPEKPPEKLAAQDVEQWMRLFGIGAHDPTAANTGPRQEHDPRQGQSPLDEVFPPEYLKQLEQELEQPSPENQTGRRKKRD